MCVCVCVCILQTHKCNTIQNKIHFIYIINTQIYLLNINTHTNVIQYKKKNIHTHIYIYVCMYVCMYR